MVQEKNDNLCKFCGEVLAKGDYHEEFDYFKHPIAKGQLNALNEKYKALPKEEQLYRMENYAVRRGLRRNATITDDKGQKRPVGGTVVMPAYGRLVYADIWLRKMNGEAVKYLPPTALPRVSTELPF